MSYIESMGTSADEKRMSRELQGKRLICEASFDREEVDAWCQELTQQGIFAWSIHPSLAAVATVGVGVYHYKHGDFWSAFTGLDSPADQSNWGRKFEKFLDEHESLEAFQSLKQLGHRYVAPILAHGGVPQYCLSDFFELLTRHGDPEQQSSDFIDFLSEHQASMVNIDKPVQRFLLYGSEVAEEFVARSLALWQSRERGDGGGTHGLPSRVVEAFSKWYAERGPTQRQHIRRLPKPAIRMSPGDLWVYLRLPRCDDHPEVGPNACWEVGGKTWAVSRDHAIPLPLGDSWTVKRKGHEVILQGINDSEPALFFDPPTGKIIPNPRLRRLPERLWGVFQESMDVDPEPLHAEPIPDWAGYVVAIFNLEGQKYLKVGEHLFEVRRPFFHCEQDPVVENVTSEGGLSVFHAPPQINWEGKANFSLSRHGSNEGNIDIKSDDFQMWFDEPGQYEFILRGPLGQNIRKSFVLIPGLKLHIQPEVMWPDTTWLECDISADQVDIRTSDGRPPPFISHEPYFRFQASFGETAMTLIANVPRLRWRVVMSSEEASEWKTKVITSTAQDLEQADYPRFVCEMGQLAKEVDVSLIGRYGSIKPPQGQRSAVSQKNTWAFDLRMVLDQVRQSGLAEEFDISVQALDGIQLYRGTAMTVRPKWNLHDFRAERKKEDEEHIIRVEWRESGNAIAGRWLVLIPLWRPWEDMVISHQLGEEERMSFEWRFETIRPGRYVVRAVHAPWGCEDWIEAKHAVQQIIDVAKDSWEETFEKQASIESVEKYAESLLAHWYRPQLVKQPPLTPTGLSDKDIKRFLNHMVKTCHLEAVQIPRDGSGSLNIFLQNSKAAANALENEQNWPQIWARILPNKNIVDLAELSPQDKLFILALVEHWIDGFDGEHFQEAARDTISQLAGLHVQEHLSSPIQEWFLNVKRMRGHADRGLMPKPDDVIFICERFSLVERASDNFLITQYKKLKAAYQCREAI